MTIKTYTVIEKDNRREFGYGLYINAYIVDTSFAEMGVDDGQMGLYASECVPFNATNKQIAQARRRVRQNARNRYRKEPEDRLEAL